MEVARLLLIKQLSVESINLFRGLERLSASKSLIGGSTPAIERDRRGVFYAGDSMAAIENDLSLLSLLFLLLLHSNITRQCPRRFLMH